MFLFSKPKKESPYKLACPVCGENLSSLNQAGDYSCDHCHKLYAFPELMEAYSKLANENYHLKVTREFHKMSAESIAKDLQAARLKIHQLENEITSLRLEALESIPRNNPVDLENLDKRVQVLENFMNEI